MAPQAIYRTVDSILQVLNQSSENNEAVANLLTIYNNTLQEYENAERCETSGRKRKPFVVLEGLDGCGKSTITKKLGSRFGARKCTTPPESIKHLRHLFDDHPELRTAYYALGNYIAALEVALILKQQPVIMDRYWHSTSGFGIAQSVHDYPGEIEMPPEGDAFYNWPMDLLKPDKVFFLDVNESIRKERLKNRPSSTTQEKLLLESDSFRNNITLAYRNMVDPQVIFINANFFPNKVVKQLDDKLADLFS